MRNERVGHIEKWLKSAPFDAVNSIFVEYKLKKDIDQTLSEYEITPQDLVRAARLSTDQILEHYRTDRSPTPTAPDQAGIKAYQEHVDGLLVLVKRLSSELDIDLARYPVRGLGKIGSHSSSAGRNFEQLHWQVNKGSLVSLSLSMEAAEDIDLKIRRDYLFCHLSSSSYSWLLSEKRRGIELWKRLGGEELKRRSRLLRYIDKQVETLTGKNMLDPNLADKPGPLPWFAESIWAAALDGLYRSLDYRVELVRPGLLAVHYGASFIGMVENEKQGEIYISLHQQLMKSTIKSRTVKMIRVLKDQRNKATEAIKESLAKILVDKRLPGSCNSHACGLYPGINFTT
jgi:hypothetical protein